MCRRSDLDNFKVVMVIAVCLFLVIPIIAWAGVKAKSVAETFDVGRDTGTQVTKIYKDPFPFEGDLKKVVITLTD